MTQADVLIYLELNKREWFSTNQINKAIGANSVGSTSTNLKNLRRHKLVDWKLYGKLFLYRFKDVKDPLYNFEDDELVRIT